MDSHVPNNIFSDPDVMGVDHAEGNTSDKQGDKCVVRIEIIGIQFTERFV